MSSKYVSALTSPGLLDAYADFILSRQSDNARETTLEFYHFTVGKFLEWSERAHGITHPDQLTARYVREYIAMLAAKGRKDTTLWNNARAIKTMFSFWHTEGYMQVAVKFELPRVQKKKNLPRLNAEQLQIVLRACNTRDRAIVMFMADGGSRRKETLLANWEHVNMATGLVFIPEGKGGKPRTTAIGAKTRRALLAYRRSLPPDQRDGILFKTDEGTRFTGSGLRCVYRRLSAKTGLHVTCHGMRRTFTILSLRAEMDPLHLQGLGGWESMDMVYHYAQMEDIDLLQAHRKHSPVDNLDKLKLQ